MNSNVMTFSQEISAKKRLLCSQVGDHMTEIANGCINKINNFGKLDFFLKKEISKLNHCSMLYVTDCNYKQISSNITSKKISPDYRGQNLSDRPYLQSSVPLKGMILSEMYRDERTGKTCMTLLHAIHLDDGLKGFLFADYNLNDISLDESIRDEFSHVQQFKGDPAIRGGLFHQQRNESILDNNIDRVNDLVKNLYLKHGVFHIKLHYSSSRFSLWLYDNPHHYQLHTIDEILDGTVFSCYPKLKYPKDACVTEDQIHQAYKQFKQLRYADDNVYLRSASLNIINGMVGLNFSCDGSHYIPVKEFIDNSLEYWMGKALNR